MKWGEEIIVKGLSKGKQSLSQGGEMFHGRHCFCVRPGNTNGVAMGLIVRLRPSPQIHILNY